MILGLWLPIHYCNVRQFLVENAYFGTERFKFDGNGADLVPAYLLTLLLTIPTLGLIWIWYAGYRHRFYWEHTSFGEARFQSTVRAYDLIRLYAINAVLIIISLGLAIPWAVVITKRYFLANLALQGSVDFNPIAQQFEAVTGAGAELTGLSDADSFLG